MGHYGSPAYVDIKPVRAGLVGGAAEYPWSSARAQFEGSDERANALCTAIANGLALRDEDFISKLERISARQLRSGKRGPAPRAPETASVAAGSGVP